MKNITAIVLAAGKGTRMKSELPKVLHPVCGVPMAAYPLNIIKKLGFKETVFVVGHKSEDVKAAFSEYKNLKFCVQMPQLGTGHAVMCAMKYIKNFSGAVLILSGDVPLIKEETISALVNMHKDNASAVTFISMLLSDPTGYGRVVRDKSGKVERIVEHKDLVFGQEKIKEVNSGIYLIDYAFLRENIKKLSSANAQGEYYLPDLISIAKTTGKKISCITHADPEEVMGVNNRIELARANTVMRTRLLNHFMMEGVTIIDPSSTYIDSGVSIGADTIVYPGSHLTGKTSVGANCTILEGVVIKNSKIEEGVTIKSYSVIESSVIKKAAIIGPYARIRPESEIAEGAHIGNFVEIKKSKIGKGSKANHLSYIGDSTVGEGVNIGAGTITCNYDGVEKHRTVIQDGAFIGSDSQLVAPVTVGKGAYIGSGSTITKNVPPLALALTRSELRVVTDWAKRKFASKTKNTTATPKKKTTKKTTKGRKR